MTDTHSRLASALSDRYRIERELGQGAMAIVYLAHDIKHDRKVALKVLKPELAAVLGAQRFIVEIKTTAALQHPHILPLFDSGEVDGFLFYVMPFIDGETLRAKLGRETQLPVAEAIAIASDVADALHYAHTHGVIHRDIKPENILLANGRPMVADFGIALAVSAAAGRRMTETGLTLGTPHYMSPEQATAEKEISARSDIYSLASVLYEMLTGNPPHTGATAQQIIMRIVTENVVPVTHLRKAVPEHVADALAQALEKLPADRFSSAAEFAAALNGRLTTHAIAHHARDKKIPEPWRRIVIGACAVALVSIAVAGWALLGNRLSGGISERVEFAYRPNNAADDRTEVEISRDGRRIVQALKDSSGVRHIVIRELSSTALTVVPGTDGAEVPSFSPDDQSIVFRADGKLRRIAATGGPSTVLADQAMGGASWGDDGTIIYTKSSDGLWRVSAGGGPPMRVTTLDTSRNEFNHWYPQLLPGGDNAIYTSYSTPIDRSRIEVVNLKTGRQTVLIEDAIFGRYVASGHLLFARADAIFAVPFDVKKLKVLGPPEPVIDNIAWTPSYGAVGFSVSENGTLVYIKGTEWRLPRRVLWADRAGNKQPLLAESGLWAEPRLSPDGRWLAVTRLDPDFQIWIWDIERRVLSQLTHSAGASTTANWMPDSRSLIHTVEQPVFDLVRTPINGTAQTSVFSTPFDKAATSISPDGKTVAYYERFDHDRLMFVPVGGGAAVPLEVRPTSQRNGDFSPNGRWFTYEELDQTQTPQVFVRELSGSDGRRQVSDGSGDQPRWTRGGREIVYRKGDDMLAVSFEPETGAVGKPVLLFRCADAGRLLGNRSVGYDVTPDGSRFVLVVPEERPGAQPVVVVLNWLEELKQRVKKP